MKNFLKPGNVLKTGISAYITRKPTHLITSLECGTNKFQKCMPCLVLTYSCIATIFSHCHNRVKPLNEPTAVRQNVVDDLFINKYLYLYLYLPGCCAALKICPLPTLNFKAIINFPAKISQRCPFQTLIQRLIVSSLSVSNRDVQMSSGNTEGAFS